MLLVMNIVALAISFGIPLYWYISIHFIGLIVFSSVYDFSHYLVKIFA